MSISDAMKLIVSIGRISRGDFGEIPVKAKPDDVECKLEKSANQPQENPL
jgi:hypothetical protein